MTEHDGAPGEVSRTEANAASTQQPSTPRSAAPESQPDASASGVDPRERPSQVPEAHPSYLFFGVVASIALVADVVTKAWAEITLTHRSPTHPSVVLVRDHLNLTLAYNKGGAWGILQDSAEAIRKPFFFIVSLAAIAFIVSLFSRVQSRQHALKWGLPLVLGGALGNLADRVIRSSVVDFIDYRAAWIDSMNRLIAKVFPSWGVTDHWPTFNLADVAICIGVGLMALDMFTSRRVPVGGGRADDEGDVDGEEPESPTQLSEHSAPAPSEPPSV